ncbi:MAG TPA: methyltransferase domain-containing protein [Anaerolineales bacterium]|nr:methyltransferase domain-containing protein [Anaerolineales bacterium]
MIESNSIQPPLWSEQISQQFIDFAEYFVPDRKIQMEIIRDLIPVVNHPIHVLEICCGEGLLAQTILDKREDISIIGIDGSSAMLWKARQRLSSYGSRFQTFAFEISQIIWQEIDIPFHAVISSLAIHHLDRVGKQRLYQDIYQHLMPGGVLIVADLVEPASESSKQLAAELWDQAVMHRSLELDCNLKAFEAFQNLHWNLFRFPDEMDIPSPLTDHFHWLAESGFQEIDTYWMRAGHAIYGGVKPRVPKTP